jgi:hypothetical protein
MWCDLLHYLNAKGFPASERTMFEGCNNVGSPGKPRGENLDAFAPRLDCKNGDFAPDLIAK